MAPSAAASTTSAGRRYGALGTGALVASGLAYVGLADPHRPGFLFPPCPFRALTGLDCPGCGGIRMTHDLLHGDLAAAVTDNAFALVGIPLLAIWLVVRWRRGRRLLPPWAIVIVAATAILWTVVRNWPGFPLVPTFVGG